MSATGVSSPVPTAPTHLQNVYAASDQIIVPAYSSAADPHDRLANSSARDGSAHTLFTIENNHLAGFIGNREGYAMHAPHAPFGLYEQIAHNHYDYDNASTHFFAGDSQASSIFGTRAIECPAY